jgi:hypothetical protein
MIRKMAEKYAKNQISYPFIDVNEVHKLFAEFNSQIKTVNTKGELKPTLYAQIVARMK